MRKLEPIKDDAQTFINNVIASSNKKGRNNEESKRETKEFRDSCSTVVSENEQIIKLYDKDFESNTLEDLENKGQLIDDVKDNFLSLYSFRKKAISQLRNTVLTEGEYMNDICPLCECDTVTTMDHYLPKNKYALFIVHPRNLIPCCSACNEHKSDIVFENGKRKYWNCYLDSPIEKPYLKCIVNKSKNGLIGAEFTIDKGKLLEQEAFVIENTLGNDGQNVIGQYKKMVGNEISVLIKRISGLMMNGDEFDDSIQKIKEVDLSNRILNNWKNVLEEALLNSDAFLNFAKKESEKIIEKSKLGKS
ncbi:MAG: hypothetical protein CW341_03125 [Bacteroidetes bacterium]|nr:hypothetical protein [Bacteroidota bacterium]